MTLHLKIKRWIALCVVLPVCVILVGVNWAAWRHFKHAHNARLVEPHRLLSEEIEQILGAEIVRLRSLAVLPNVDQLLTSAERSGRSVSMSGRQDRAGSIAEQWAELGRDELIVRTILNNSVGEMFRFLTEHESSIRMLLLTDAQGVLIAASDKPDRYEFAEQGWWSLARAQRSSRPVADGDLQDGRLGVALSIWDPANPGRMRGVLYLQIDLPAFDHLADAAAGDDTVTVLVGRSVWTPAAGRTVEPEVLARIAEEFSAEGAGFGWQVGYRFIGDPLRAQTEWAGPVWIITLRAEGRYPMALYGAMLMSVLASIVAMLGLIHTAHRTGRQLFIEPYTELLEAGDWVFRNALDQPMDLTRRSKANPVVEGQLDTAPSRVEQNLNDWMDRMRQDLQNAASVRTREMQHDIELAKDFQQAYLNRPYPKVPEVHYEGRLRLVFCHHYSPAMALGGDFFDLMQLAPDCAGILIADVMGHGARSALITAMMRTLLRDLSAQGRNARHFIGQVNKQFCEMLRAFPHPLFASAFYFVADTTARVATYTSAGHPAPFHVRRSIGKISRLDVPAPHGAALGLLPEEVYTGGHVRLIAGDIFLFFTDGVYEMSNPEGEEYGLQRMEKVIRRHLYKPVQVIVDHLIKDIEAFAQGEPVADDICIVAVEVTTAKEELKPAEAPRAAPGAVTLSNA